jgi:hypothetical protein
MVEKPELHILDDLNGIAEDLFELYRGDDTRFGTFDIDRLRLVDDKVEMKDEDGKGPRDVKRPPTVADVLAHLEGRRPIGIWPARKDGMTRRIVIDIDGKDVTGGYKAISQVAVVKKCEKLGLSFLVDSLSKSGGVHLDCFLTEWVAQARAYALGRQMAVRLGFPKCEIFPPESGTENWVILPYFGGAMPGKHSKQYCLSREPGKLWMTLPEFRDFAKASPVTPEAVEAAVRKARPEKDTDGPARAKRDLEAFAAEIAGAVKGTRGALLNKRAFQMGTMVGAKWIEEGVVFDTLKAAAERCGLSPSEAGGHIGNGLRDGKEEKPQDDDVIFPVIADMIKWQGGDETEWEFETGHGRIRMPVGEALNYWKFNQRCGEELDVVFQPVKQPEWNKRLYAAVRTADVRQVPPDQTPQGMFLILLRDFCTNTWAKRDHKAEDDIRALLLKRAVRMEDEGRIYFRFIDLRNFLTDHPMFKAWSATKIGTMLNKIGKEGVDWDITKKKLYGPDAKASDVRWVRSDFFDSSSEEPIPTPTPPTAQI